MIQQRIFIVGCPRSGTTYLQSILAAHPQLLSFPETHFFRAVGNRRRSQIGLASPSGRERKRLHRFLTQIDRRDLQHHIPRFGFLIRQYTHAFQTILDTLANEQEQSMWVEKTPDHLHYIPHIAHYIPHTKFVHIVRSGQNTVASLYEVICKNPEQWGVNCDLDWCIERWNHDIGITIRYRNIRDHCIVLYEQLVKQPATVIEKICEFIGLPYAESMLTEQAEVGERLILSTESWKERVMTGSRRERKFDRIFTAEQQQYVIDNLSALPAEWV